MEVGGPSNRLLSGSMSLNYVNTYSNNNNNIAHIQVRNLMANIFGDESGEEGGGGGGEKGDREQNKRADDSDDDMGGVRRDDDLLVVEFY